MGNYRKGGVPAKGLHVRMSDDLLLWLDEEAERRCMSRAAMMEMAVKQLRTRLTSLDSETDRQLEETNGDGD